MRDWDIWEDGPHDPAWNMAADEALLRTAPARGRPVIRVYDWDRPAATIGYFQPASQGDGTDLPWVRRTTGGGVVIHEGDQTYTVVIPADHPLAATEMTESYRLLNRCVARALERMGLRGELSSQPMARHTDLRTMVCFTQPTRYDVLADGRKVAGAAQRRTRDGILHQGSVRLDNAPSACAALRAELRCAFADELGARFRAFDLDAQFVSVVERMVRERYGTEDWNRQR